MNTEESTQRAKRFLDHSGKALAAAGGAAIGTIIGGAPAAGIGAGLGAALIEIINDITNRSLSKREAQRMSTAMAISLKKIADGLSEGKPLRADLFVNVPDNPPAADTLFESMLERAKSECEAKKMEYISNIMPNFIFIDEFNFEESLYFSRLIDELTYRQLCLLAIFSGASKIQLRSADFNDSSNLDPMVLNILVQAYSLYVKGLIVVGTDSPGNNLSVLDYQQIAPSLTRPSPNGDRFIRLMGLANIPKTDLDPIIHHLI
jgi:hypothetical protein